MTKVQHKCSDETWMLPKMQVFASVFTDEEIGETFIQESFLRNSAEDLHKVKITVDKVKIILLRQREH